MEEIRDPNRIEKLMENSRINTKLKLTGIEARVYRYCKGELITSPEKPLADVLFPVSGRAVIYGIRTGGTSFPVSDVKKGDVIGEMEFVDMVETPLFVEVKQTMECIAISSTKYRSQLSEDCIFLHTLLDSFSSKFRRILETEGEAGDTEERVMNYMENIAPSHEIKDISNIVYTLRCSRRQLQRVLRALTEQGKIERIGRGHYKLSSRRN